jgi:energy-converting hydrogenase Eha subunit F
MKMFFRLKEESVQKLYVLLSLTWSPLLTYKMLNDKFGMQISSTKGAILRHIIIHVKCLLKLFAVSIILVMCVYCCFVIKLALESYTKIYLHCSFVIEV